MVVLFKIKRLKINMADSTEYFLARGEQDSERLSIINKLYNPKAIEFMKQSGLEPGMKILEIGCGMGLMAIELSRIVGSGKIIASDISESQLQIAKKNADLNGCKNIEFLQLDINQSLLNYYNKFDMVYGRWVIEFAKDTKFTFNELYKTLKPNGIFVYEGVDVSDSEYFSYPNQDVVDKWFKLILKNWQSNKMHISFIKWLYYALKEIGSYNLKIDANQKILSTPEEKSILRLGLRSVKDTYVKKDFLNEVEYDHLISVLADIEKSDVLIGYVRNILISSRKA